MILTGSSECARSTGATDYINQGEIVLQFHQSTVSLQVNVLIINDNEVEESEQFYAFLRSSDTAVIFFRNETTVTISDIGESKQ